MERDGERREKRRDMEEGSEGGCIQKISEYLYILYMHVSMANPKARVNMMTWSRRVRRKRLRLYSSFV